jgi:hypothetical protein
VSSKTIGLACNSTELYTARREVYKEENDKSFQARRCPHSIVKKSLATICCQCRFKNSFHVVLRLRSTR